MINRQYRQYKGKNMFEIFGSKKLVAVAAPVSLAVGLALGVTNVQAGRLTDSAGGAVTNSYAECWEAAGGTDAAFEVCGDVAEVPEAVAPVVREEPAPVVVSDLMINVTADNFEFDRAELKPAMMSALDDVAAKVKAHGGGAQLHVIGHTDSTGPESYNQGLSERRAQSAANYLIDQGVSADRITTSGMGESQPVADNSTREGRAQNRRFEVKNR